MAGREWGDHGWNVVGGHGVHASHTRVVGTTVPRRVTRRWGADGTGDDLQPLFVAESKGERGRQKAAKKRFFCFQRSRAESLPGTAGDAISEDTHRSLSRDGVAHGTLLERLSQTRVSEWHVMNSSDLSTFWFLDSKHRTALFWYRRSRHTPRS